MNVQHIIRMKVYLSLGIDLCGIMSTHDRKWKARSRVEAASAEITLRASAKLNSDMLTNQNHVFWNGFGQN